MIARYVLYLTVSSSLTSSQTYRGLFHGPMVLQTFATHYTAILGAVKVPTFHKHAMEPHCALSLAAAAVSNFISLFTAVPGIITFFFSLNLG